MENNFRTVVNFYLVVIMIRLISKKQKKKILKKLKNFKIKYNFIFINYDINDFYKKSKEDTNYFHSCLFRIINYKKFYNNKVQFKNFDLNFKRIIYKKKFIHYLDLIFSYISLFFSKYLIDIQYFQKSFI